MKYLLYLAFAGAMLHGQTVSISDTITTPFGGTFSGTITVTLNNPQTAQPLYSGSETLSGWSQTVTVTNGAFSITLYPNDTITPGGTSYTARYSPSSGSPWSETWVVPTGATTIRELRSTIRPSPTVMVTPSQITQASATVGQIMRWNGSIWAPATFSALTDPTTTTGDLIYKSGASLARLAIGTSGQCLTVSAGAPAWATCASGGGGAWGDITGTLSAQTDLQNALNAKVTSGGALGTPTSGTLTNATGLPLATGVTGVLPAANGGAGTINGILKANGSGAVSVVASADIRGLWTGTCDNTTYLRGDGACGSPSGGAHTQNTDTGTTSASFQIDSGSSGPRIKNSSGTLQVRNAADDALAPLAASNLSGTNTGDQTSVSGNAGTATALAANGANCAAGTFPPGVDASGAAENCTALPTAIVGTANEITASAATGTVTLSIPSTFSLAGKTSFTIPNGAAPTVSAFGHLAGDNDLWAASRGAPVFHDGTAAVALVGVLASDTPSNGQVPTWNTGGTITWETPSGGGGGAPCTSTALSLQYNAAGSFGCISSLTSDGTSMILGNGQSMKGVRSQFGGGAYPIMAVDGGGADILEIGAGGAFVGGINLLGSGGSGTGGVQILIGGAPIFAARMMNSGDYVGTIAIGANNTATTDTLNVHNTSLTTQDTTILFASNSAQSSSSKLFRTTNNAGTEQYAQTAGGVLATYGAIPTAGQGVPPIYSSVALAAQTASISTANLQCGGAVCPAGLYRVFVEAVTTTAGTSGTMDVTIGWHDGTASRTASPAAQLVFGTTTRQSGDIVFTADGTNNITYATTVASAVGSPAYSLKVTLERLQ